MTRRRAASRTAALLVAAALAGCGSSREQPAGRFVFSSGFATPNASRLFVIGADGKGFHKVTPGLAFVGEGNADWSPDGTRIVFDRTYDCAGAVGSCSAIWVVNQDGSGERRLTRENAKRVTSALAPTWSPDGRTIAYVLLDGRSESADVWVMAADGSMQRRLTRVGDAKEPAWAPDGRKIAFSSQGDLLVLDVDTGSLERLTKTPKLAESYPDWSPDGERIAYELNDPVSTECDAYVIDADGTDSRKLSQPRYTDGQPVWSPGGQLIAFGSDREAPAAGLTIVIVDADSGDTIRQIPAPVMNLYPIDWTGE